MELFLTSVKNTLESMVKAFNPDAAKGWNRVIQYVIKGEGGGVWQMIIRDQRCSLLEGEQERPDLKILTDVDTWMKLQKGEMSPTRAIMTRKLRTEGSFSDLMKLQGVFKAS